MLALADATRTSHLRARPGLTARRSWSAPSVIVLGVLVAGLRAGLGPPVGRRESLRGVTIGQTCKVTMGGLDRARYGEGLRTERRPPKVRSRAQEQRRSSIGARARYIEEPAPLRRRPRNCRAWAIGTKSFLEPRSRRRLAIRDLLRRWKSGGRRVADLREDRSAGSSPARR